MRTPLQQSIAIMGLFCDRFFFDAIALFKMPKHPARRRDRFVDLGLPQAVQEHDRRYQVLCTTRVRIICFLSNRQGRVISDHLMHWTFQPPGRRTRDGTTGMLAAAASDVTVAGDADSIQCVLNLFTTSIGGMPTLRVLLLNVIQTDCKNKNEIYESAQNGVKKRI